MTRPAPRRRFLTFALAALCAALAVLAFVPPPPASAPESTGPVAVAPLAAGDNGGPLIRARAERGPAFKRPIFVPSRRLPEQAGNGDGSGGGVEGLKLNAVFLGPEIAKALLTTMRAREGQWVTPGQTLEGWRIEEIEAESVTLAGPGGLRKLQLEKPETAPVRRTRKYSRKRPASPAGKADAPSSGPKGQQTEQEPE